MYLKKVEIYGFKSFADKIEISFKDGITAIVGPNGSGKSNILDAIKWVLGEQKVKSLRGQRMEDVIFSGTQIRKPLGYAEVKLTIDNSSGIFPIEYNELSVTRRLFRSGDSEYYINKSQCRLKDIHDLFSDTGLGKEGYSIIGQGKIDHIVSSNPYERRLLLEEAAGIVKYKNRKNESERKLDKTQENLYRITDIILELEKQLTPLHNQSEKAKVYLDVREHLKRVELNIFVHKTEEIGNDLTQFQADRDIIIKNIEDKEKQLQIKDTQYQQLRKETNGLEDTMSEIDQSILHINHTLEEYNTKIQVSLTKIELNNKTIQSIREELFQIEEIKKQLHQKSQGIQVDIKELEETLQNHRVNVESNALRKKTHQEHQETLTKRHTEKKESLAYIQKNINECTNGIQLLENKMNYYTDHLSSLETKLTEMVMQNDQHQRQQINLRKREESIDHRIKNHKIAMNEKKIEYEEHKNEYMRLEKELQVYQNNAQVLSSKYHLMSNNEELKGYYNSVRLLLKEKTTNPYLNSNLHDIVGNLLQVDKNYALAIETALGNAVQNLVTENEHVAHECIKLLNKNKWGRATFLPLNIISGESVKVNHDIAQESGYIDIASNLIRYAQPYDKLFKNLLGKVLVVKDYESGINISRKTHYRFKIVTLQGEIFYPGGAIVGGPTQRSNGKNIIQRKQELIELKQEIKEIKLKIDTLEKKQQGFKSFVQESEQAVEHLQYEFNELLMEKKLTQQNLIQTKAIIGEGEESLNKIKLEIEKLMQEKQSDFQEMNGLVQNLNVLQGEQKLIEDKDVAMGETNCLLEDIQEIDKEITELNLIIAKLEEKQFHLNHQKKDILENIQTQLNRYSMKREQLTEMRLENDKLMEYITEIEGQLSSLKEERLQLQQKNDVHKADKSTKNDQFDRIQKDIKDLNGEHILMTEALNKIDIKMNNKKYELQSLQENIFENYGVNYVMACDYRYAMENVNHELKLLKTLKDKIKGLGNVNITAIQQYKEIKERYAFLSHQKDDLIKAKEELKNIIQEITINMEQQFIEKFKQIQEGFNHTFKQLFNGGSARLILEDSTDIMETGIEIEAQPPGKKLKNISLLSGGEKSLTAIALLFAIIIIKPTPFCVLDEIDAALDDSNVDRFSKFLANVSCDNQFITITHRKGTMEIAHRLYGVSMGSDGVSKVISVELSDIIDEEEKIEIG
ncbi:MAG: chromosome segregation protein SMC [Eubacteriales bacterium]